jgi:putative colanic acid biosynthesis acetyltransferase WcaF
LCVKLQQQHLSRQNKLARLLWRTVWILLYRPSPRMFHVWRRFLLRMFGAKLGVGTYAYPSVQIWAPWNLEMQDHSCLSHFVDCYCVNRVVIGHHATVSQYSFLCTASHDYNRADMPLVTAPIVIGAHAWVTADVFVGPGVTIGQGAVVAARSTVTRDVPPWTVVAGSPAKHIGQRDRRAFEQALSRQSQSETTSDA